MLEKLKAMGEYIKNNNVGDDIRQRFTNVLQKYKDQVGGGVGNGIKTSTDAMTAHGKILSKLQNYRKKVPLVPDHNQLVKERLQAEKDLNEQYQKDPNKDTDDVEHMKDEFKKASLSSF